MPLKACRAGDPKHIPEILWSLGFLMPWDVGHSAKWGCNGPSMLQALQGWGLHHCPGQPLGLGGDKCFASLPGPLLAWIHFPLAIAASFLPSSFQGTQRHGELLILHPKQCPKLCCIPLGCLCLSPHTEVQEPLGQKTIPVRVSSFPCKGLHLLNLCELSTRCAVPGEWHSLILMKCDPLLSGKVGKLPCSMDICLGALSPIGNPVVWAGSSSCTRTGMAKAKNIMGCCVSWFGREEVRAGEALS